MAEKFKIINPEQDARWDEFVLNHREGELYHHSAWGRVISSSFGYRPFYIALEQEDRRLAGVVPFMYVDSRITGKRLVSLPFTSYCNPLLPEAELESAVAFAVDHHPGIDFVELKLNNKLQNHSAALKATAEYVTHVLELQCDPEQLFKCFHATSIRQRIRRAGKNNLTLKLAESEKDLKEFYRLHVSVRKKHGLPPHPYVFFKNMWHILRPLGAMLVPLINDGAQVLAGSILLRFKDSFYLEYTASDQDRLKESPNQMLIWEAIKIACNAGAKTFDFGRSSLTNTPLIESKERWATKAVSLHYYYHPDAKGMDTENSAKRRILAAVNRFLPSALLRLEGKILYPHIG